MQLYSIARILLSGQSSHCYRKIPKNATLFFSGHKTPVFVSSYRNTWILKHVKPLPPANEAEFEFQRHPSEKQEFQIYQPIFGGEDGEEGSRYSDPETTIQVILTGYLEEHGNRYDVVTLEKDFARELILLGKAVYASPENMGVFEDEMKARAEELKRLPPMSPFAMKSARLLNKTVFPIEMNIDVEWTLEPWNLSVALRAAGIHVSADAIVQGSRVSGPDLSLENSLIRFYVVMNCRIIVPVLGRIQHVTQDEARKVVSSIADPTKTSPEEMKHNGVEEEEIYIHDSLIDSETDVLKIIQERNKI